MSGVLKEVITHARDYDFETIFGELDKATIYPLVYEIPKDKTGTLKDQGKVGACVAEVVCQIAEVLWKDILGEEALEMSEGFSYASLRGDDHDGYGLIISQAMKLWCEIGTLPKKYFDKLCEMPDIKTIVDAVPDFYQVAQKYRISGYCTLNYANKAKRDSCIKQALSSLGYGIVAVSHDWFSGGSHCIQIVGWNDESDTYIFKNSWGKDYGEDGFAKIPKSEIDCAYLPVLEDIKLPFSDVHEDAWYYKFVKNMYFSGLMKGTSEDSFEPDRAITRAEAAALSYNILKAMDERFDILNKILK